MDITITQILHRLLPDIEWVMNDDDLATLSILTADIAKPTQTEVDQMRQTILAERLQSADAKAALLNRLGITAEEAKLLLS